VWQEKSQYENDITTGRISISGRAVALIEEKKADRIGLAPMLWVDPAWPTKAFEG